MRCSQRPDWQSRWRRLERENIDKEIITNEVTSREKKNEIQLNSMCKVCYSGLLVVFCSVHFTDRNSCLCLELKPYKLPCTANGPRCLFSSTAKQEVAITSRRIIPLVSSHSSLSNKHTCSPYIVMYTHLRTHTDYLLCFMVLCRVPF